MAYCNYDVCAAKQVAGFDFRYQLAVGALRERSVVGQQRVLQPCDGVPPFLVEMIQADVVRVVR